MKNAHLVISVFFIYTANRVFNTPIEYYFPHYMIALLITDFANNF
jgi:hypothetical protein